MRCDVHSYNMEGKVKFKKKKFGGARRSRPVEEGTEEETNFGAVESNVRRTKVNRWAKYLSLGEESESKDTENTRKEENAGGKEDQAGNEENTAGREYRAGGIEDHAGGISDRNVNSNLTDNHINISKSTPASLAEDDPMVVDMDAVMPVDSLGAYTKVASNTFTVTDSHFRDSVPTITREYDDLDEDPNPKKVDDYDMDNDDVDMYDAEVYDVKPRTFESDLYAYEIMSDASEEPGVKISPVKVASIGDLISGLKQEVEGLRASILSSNGELNRLKVELDKAAGTRLKVVSEL